MALEEERETLAIEGGEKVEKKEVKSLEENKTYDIVVENVYFVQPLSCLNRFLHELSIIYYQNGIS